MHTCNIDTRALTVSMFQLSYNSPRIPIYLSPSCAIRLLILDLYGCWQLKVISATINPWSLTPLKKHHACTIWSVHHAPLLGTWPLYMAPIHKHEYHKVTTARVTSSCDAYTLLNTKYTASHNFLTPQCNWLNVSVRQNHHQNPYYKTLKQ